MSAISNTLPIWFWLGFLPVGTLGGILVGYFARKVWAGKQIEGAEAKLQKALEEAKKQEQEFLFKAKEKALKVIDEAKRDESDRRKEMQHQQSRLEQRESQFDSKLLQIEKSQQQVQEKENRLENVRKELEQIREQQVAKLEKIAELTKEEAKRVLMEATERDMKDELTDRIRKFQEESGEEIDRKAKSLISLAIQRVASPHTAETTTTIVNLPNEEMKGRIIGKEGRNIKALELMTGVEIIVDETPESIVVSGFSPVRRQVAKRTLDRLMADGRIHPGRIEDTVEQAKKEIAQDMKKAGEEAAYEVGVVGMDPKLLQLLGRLKYRTSYGQNVLRHSIEVATLAGLLAEELGANVSVCKKGGLLHDIGKALDHDIQGTHPEIGYDILRRKFKMPEEIAYQCISHHEDSPKTIEGSIVKAADAISGSRPGARKDSIEHYIQRLEELEKLAGSFEGVEKAYAIQAGREIRVFVKPEKIDDYAAIKLAREVANSIEKELQYPGEIKVTVIREKRIIEYAR
ncbi:MAG: ribonuclease Y [Patescibacteria group bacterium]